MEVYERIHLQGAGGSLFFGQCDILAETQEVRKRVFTTEEGVESRDPQSDHTCGVDDQPDGPLRAAAGGDWFPHGETGGWC